MICELRTYTIAHGHVGDYLRLYGETGLPIQCRHLGAPLGYFSTEVGTLNKVVHLWRFESHADREARRAALESDPEWIAYRRQSVQSGYVVQQENCLLRAAPFFNMETSS